MKLKWKKENPEIGSREPHFSYTTEHGGCYALVTDTVVTGSRGRDRIDWEVSPLGPGGMDHAQNDRADSVAAAKRAAKKALIACARSK